MKIAILGTGAYGLSLALMLNENDNQIKLWTKFEEEYKTLIFNSGNPKLLPKVILPKEFSYTTNMEECLKDSDIIFITVPAAHVDSVSFELSKYYNNQYVCLGSKGIEQDTCMFVSDVFLQNIKTDKLAVLSGPSFAVDIASYVPIGLSLASNDKDTANVIKSALENKYMKIRTCNDVLGVEICGSIKNIIAIACGIVDGMGFPESSKAMLITESMHDIKELIDALGGNKKTIMSYAGIGDLILTCTSTKSRNFTFGKMVGLGKTFDEIEEYKNNTTIEGLYTLQSIYKLLKNRKVKIPIIDIMYKIIVENANKDLLIKFLREKA